MCMCDVLAKQRSVEIYNAALELDPTNKTAQDGLKEAKTTAAAKVPLEPT